MRRLIREKRSFGYALRGIYRAIRTEDHIQFHLVATIAVLSCGSIAQVSLYEWFILLLCIGNVWMAEMVNTAIEKLVDLVSPDYHPLAGQVKDIAAGAVLVISIIAAIIGLLILIPPLYQRFILLTL